MNLYAVYDRVAEDSGPVFEQKSHALALRQFRIFLDRHPEHNPDDFSLLFLGCFDHEENILSPEPVAETIHEGSLLDEPAALTKERREAQRLAKKLAKGVSGDGEAV